MKLDKGIIWTIIVGIIGIAAGYLFFELSEKGAIPVYISENDDSRLIYEANSPSDDLKLIYKDSIILSENIYLNTIYVWNDGKKPITKENIRKPLKIILKGGSSILDFR